jgi:hypothetical protein
LHVAAGNSDDGQLQIVQWLCSVASVQAINQKDNTGLGLRPYVSTLEHNEKPILRASDGLIKRFI